MGAYIVTSGYTNVMSPSPVLMTLPLTVPAGTKLLVGFAAWVKTDGTDNTLSRMRWNSVEMTPLRTEGGLWGAPNAYPGVYACGMANPAPGSYNLEFQTGSSPVAGVAFGLALNGIDPGASLVGVIGPRHAVDHNGALDGTSCSDTIANMNGSDTLLQMVARLGNASITPGAGQTALLNQLSAANELRAVVSMKPYAAGSTISHSWAVSAHYDFYSLVIAGIKRLDQAMVVA